MPKILVKILIIACIASALAISWHTEEMASGMMNDNGMSAACLTVCLTHGDAAAPAVALFFAVAACLALVIFLLEFFTAPVGFSGLVGQFQRDRHRYLMRTTVMLR
jgi:hypothetical protein